MWFTSQAPAGNWDALHEDACEEASLLMVRQFYKKNMSMSAQEADTEIQRLVHLGEKLGQEPSINLDGLKLLLEKAYSGSSAHIVRAVTKQALIAELTAGKPVIIPAAGRELHNPHFTAPGPLYHMLVVRGYDPAADTFITNDPGTRFGEGYAYPSQTLIDAIHDYNEADITAGKPAYLVFD
jgi:hypothetical protein